MIEQLWQWNMNNINNDAHNFNNEINIFVHFEIFNLGR